MDDAIRFSSDGPELPGEFLDSLLSGDIVFLCGTGVSAELPDFPRLVQDTYKKLGLSPKPAECEGIDKGRFEEVLGSLDRRLADPLRLRRVISEILAVPSSPDLDQHRTVLRLSHNLDNRISVVTTNFDTLLERAATEFDHGGRASFECAREWQPRLGRAFTENLARRLRSLSTLDRNWQRIWRLFSLVESPPQHDPRYATLETRLASGLVLNTDLERSWQITLPTFSNSRPPHSGRRSPLKSIST